MTEDETRAELIDPKLRESGWGVIEDTKVFRNHAITKGRIQIGGRRETPKRADYVLSYRNQKLAVIEAKSSSFQVGEGVAQAKEYASKMCLETTFSTNGKEIYQICLSTGEEKLIDRFPTPDELWKKTFPNEKSWRDKFDAISFNDISGTKLPYFYQEIAVRNVLSAIANNRDRILLTLATGTGKTFIAFQIAWKLFHARWNLKRDGSRCPRILFLADRNILVDQAFNDFSEFPEDALIRISPKEIRKRGKVPTNGSIFFTIFQTFMTGKKNKSYFGDYPSDYFDFIIIDECHRGGANDESNWRGILEYFSPAVQLGLTATPKRKGNANTYAYFGDPVYTYSLKEGINDGFLTPFKVKRIQTTLDEYIYTSDDTIIEGEVEEGKIYQEADFNRIIEIKAKEANRVNIFLSMINQNEKTIVFCSTQDHAAAVRDLINQKCKNKNPFYCVRVTANDGTLGDQYLLDFRDNEKSIPTILTTSKKLSTGVDARNVRNIVLMRPVNTMIEFKQIIGRGTRTFDGKEYFTIYDFVGAYHHFNDPSWDGEPLDEATLSEGRKFEVYEPSEPYILEEEQEENRRTIVKIKLRDGKERQIQHMVATSFWSADGTPISAEEFMQNLYGSLPEFFSNEDELRQIWSDPSTRQALLEKLEKAGYSHDVLIELQKLINAEESDLFDVLEYVAYNITPITREIRVAKAQSMIFTPLNNKQKRFLEFVLSKYIESGVEELAQEKLPDLLRLKYRAIADAQEELGSLDEIKNIFTHFQKHLYQIRSQYL
ncbi:MAG: Type restriction-modification system, restriction subunit [Gammaproteobacteria bacterium]|jgi:type I restriction enzyme R subunit|nr:Type restriction-modification system, restriction subunit [Gammaproteobacteria bacterium]